MENKPLKIAINAVTDLFSELIKNGVIKMSKEKQGGEVEPKDSKINCSAEIIPSKLDFVVELEAELNESLLRNKELENELDHIKNSDNLVIDSYKLEVQELNVALEAAAEIFKNLHTYCFTLDSHWGLEINKWLKGYKEISTR